MRIQKSIAKLLFIFGSLFYLAQPLGTKCNQYIEDSYFTLDPLKQTLDYNYTMPDNSIIYWNFCKMASTKCGTDLQSQQSRDAYALVISEDKKKCIKLTADQKLGDFKENLINKDKPENGIELIIINGDNYNEDGSLKWEVEFIINCEETQTKSNSTTTTTPTNNLPFRVSSVKIDKNRYIIEGKSSYGCPVLQLSKIWEFLGKHKIIFSIILISVGLFECFFGYRLLKPTLFLVGYFTGFGFLVAILGEFIIGPDTDSMVVWIILLVTILFGALLGFIMMYLKHVGFFCLGFWLGTILAFLLNNAVFYKLQKDTILWILIGVLGSVFGGLSILVHQHIAIIATGFVGAYSLIRPFGWIASGFPNEFALVDQIRHGKISEIPPEFYLYLSLIFLIGLMGIRFQYYYYFKQLKEKKDFTLEGIDNEEAEEDEAKEGGILNRISQAFSRKSVADKGGKKSNYQELEKYSDSQFSMNSSDEEDDDEKQKQKMKKNQKKKSFKGGDASLQESLLQGVAEKEVEKIKKKGKAEVEKQKDLVNSKVNKLQKQTSLKKKQVEEALDLKDFMNAKDGDSSIDIDLEEEENKKLQSKKSPLKKQNSRKSYNKQNPLQQKEASEDDLSSEDASPKPKQQEKKKKKPQRKNTKKD